mmetsp:Transcript_38966/g.51387  ORF Transcript_38966/g.51387 Transcript_38966/m.51387 type:complete len:226 (-) Transcript_38966:185-862(-)
MQHGFLRVFSQGKWLKLKRPIFQPNLLAVPTQIQRLYFDLQTDSMINLGCRFSSTRGPPIDSGSPEEEEEMDDPTFMDFDSLDLRGPPSPAPQEKGRRRGRLKKTRMSDVRAKRVKLADPEFPKRARGFLEHVVQALRPMEGPNNLVITLGEDRLTVNFGIHGTFVIEIQEKDQEISLISPVSGGFTYTFDRLTKRWVGTSDGHDFEGLLTRDFLRQGCIGYPDF